MPARYQPPMESEVAGRPDSFAGPLRARLRSDVKMFQQKTGGTEAGLNKPGRVFQPYDSPRRTIPFKSNSAPHNGGARGSWWISLGGSDLDTGRENVDSRGRKRWTVSNLAHTRSLAGERQSYAAYSGAGVGATIPTSGLCRAKREWSDRIQIDQGLPSHPCARPPGIVRPGLQAFEESQQLVIGPVATGLSIG